MAEEGAGRKSRAPAALRLASFLVSSGIVLVTSPAFSQDTAAVPQEEPGGTAASDQETLAGDEPGSTARAEDEASPPSEDSPRADTEGAPESGQASSSKKGAASEDDCITAARPDQQPGDSRENYLLDEQSDEERQKCLEQANAQPAQLEAKDYPLTPPPPSNENRRQDAPTAIRWSSVGAFMGMVYRPSSSESIRYKPGIAYGGYFRPELLSWLGVRLFYRKEFIPVEVDPGAFDYEDTPDLDFRQSKLNVTSLGFRIEPAWVIHPRLRLMGILGWSWLRFVAEMPTAPGFELRADRAAVEMNWQLGAGVSFDIVKNWVEISVSSTYNFVASQSGIAIDEPVQGIYQGQKVYLAPLPRFENATDVLFQLGLIL